MHITEFKTVDKKSEVLPAARMFAYYNVDEREDPSRSYHENMTFLKGIRNSKEDAFEYLKQKAEGGFYDDYAIQFYDVDSVKPTKALQALEKRLEKLKSDFNEYQRNKQIKNYYKSKLITCKGCESKIAINYLSNRASNCPVCGTDLRADYILNRIKKYKSDIKSLERKIRDEKEKQTKKAKIKWAFKVEVHG